MKIKTKKTISKIASKRKYQKKESFWDSVEELIGTVDGPKDGSLEVDHYAYGMPKRNSKK